MPDFKVIGKRTEKVDALDRVTGKAAFGADISLVTAGRPGDFADVDAAAGIEPDVVRGIEVGR